uniref:Immunoglobulin domain-containing protein n=1 Tax=Seriola dumerili TaxID=41447 RepID=A0A3B4V6U1_SERDU
MKSTTCFLFRHINLLLLSSTVRAFNVIVYRKIRAHHFYVTATEGEAVTLDCGYNSSSTGPNDHKERFSSTLNSTVRSVPLKIQKLQVSDSAVYYCALRPTFSETVSVD